MPLDASSSLSSKPGTSLRAHSLNSRVVWRWRVLLPTNPPAGKDCEGNVGSDVLFFVFHANLSGVRTRSWPSAPSLLVNGQAVAIVLRRRK